MSRIPRRISQLMYRRRSRILNEKAAKMSNDKTGWYVGNDAQTIYYTPFHKSGKIYHVIGDGYRPAAPIDIVNKLKELSERDDNNDTYFDDGYITENNYEMPFKDEVELPAGTYNHMTGNSSAPERLEPFNMRDDGFVETNNYSKVKAHIEGFLNSEEAYRSGGALYKTGIFMYGPPGNSKSSTLRTLLKDKVFPSDAVIIYVKSMMGISFINKIKDTLGDRLKVFIFEEMATIANNDQKIEFLLNFLDGENSIDNSMSFGLTNHADKLPQNIVDRPGRFDEVYLFGAPKKSEIKKILEFYAGREVTDEEVSSCEGSSVAALQQAVIFSKIKKVSINEAIKTFKKRTELVKNDFAVSKVMGLNSRNDDDMWD